MSAGKVVGKIIALPFKIVFGVGKGAIKVLGSAISMSQKVEQDFTSAVIKDAQRSDDELNRIRNSKFSTEIDKAAATYVLKNGTQNKKD